MKSGFRNSNSLIVLIFIVAASLIFLMMGLAYKQLALLRENTNWVYHSQSVSLKLEEIYANLKDIETERRDYILSRNYDSIPENIINKVNENRVDLKELRSLVRDNPEQTAKARVLERLVTEKYLIVQNTFTTNLNVERRSEVAASLMAGRKVMKNIKKQIDEMLHTEIGILKQRRDRFNFSEKSVPVYLYSIALFSLGALGFAFYRISRDLKIQEETNQNLNFSLNFNDFAQDIGNFGIWIYKAENRSIEFSDNQQKILNFTNGSLSKNISALIQRVAPEQRNLFKNNWQRWQRGEETEPFEIKLMEADGQVKYLKNITQTFVDSNGDHNLLGITTDITTETIAKINLASLNNELLWYNSIFKEAENVGDFGFLNWNLKSGELTFSENLHLIYGLEPQVQSNTFEPFLARIHPEDVKLLRETVEAATTATEEIEPFIHRIYRKNDGKLRYIRVSNKLFTANDSDYYLIICQDITAEIVVKRDIEEKNRILEANNQELEAFNYVASHDLQEPLRKIETFISRIIHTDSDHLSEVGRTYLDKTHSSASRMRKLIDDLLQFSRSTRKGHDFERTDLNEILQETKEELADVLEEKMAILKHGQLPVINVIPFQIKQLFINLIGNSLKYTKEGVLPHISIQCDLINAAVETKLYNLATGQYYRITFEDNGIGFDNEYSEKIFQLFNRLHAKKDFEGTGIGLAICRKIADNHKGFIFAEGEPGVGAKFILYLPLSN